LDVCLCHWRDRVPDALQIVHLIQIFGKTLVHPS